MEKEFSEERAREELNKGTVKAEEMLKNESKMDKFLARLEKKMKLVPLVGEALSEIPVMASMLKSYVKKQYPDLPIGVIVGILSALTYFVAPIDVISDLIPVVGYLDDAAVVAACLKLVDDDVKEYKSWRDNKQMMIEQ